MQLTDHQGCGITGLIVEVLLRYRDLCNNTVTAGTIALSAVFLNMNVVKSLFGYVHSVFCTHAIHGVLAVDAIIRNTHRSNVEPDNKSTDVIALTTLHMQQGSAIGANGAAANTNRCILSRGVLWIIRASRCIPLTS